MNNRKQNNILKIKLFIIFLMSCNQAIADTDSDRIETLIAQGQLNKALVLTNEQLTNDSNNINYLFLKGLILTRQDELENARDIFIKLTEEHPELPEPFNNLAVIYAAQGNFASARQALQKAINTHPSYATAHENLGDIYAKMASKAYNQALELDNDNETARGKLLLVSNLFSAQVRVQESIKQDKTQEAERITAQLDKLELALKDAESQTRQELNRANRIRLELINLQTERSRATKELEAKKIQAEKEANEATTKAQLARDKLARQELQASQAIEAARIEQQNIDEQSKRARSDIEEIMNELKQLMKKKDNVIKQAERDQTQALDQIDNSRIELETIRDDLARLKQQRTDLERQNRMELAKLENTRTAVTKINQISISNQLDEQDLVDVISTWAEKWSAKDITAYLSIYADDFKPAHGVTRKTWAAQRRERIQKPRFIHIGTDNVRVKFIGDQHAQIIFNQTYQSDTYSDNVEKTLLLQYINGRWLIVEEITN